MPEARLTNLKSWRIYRKMTIAELAAESGLSVGTISNMEGLKVGFSPESLLALAKALQTSTSALLMVNPLKDRAGMVWTLWDQASATQRAQIAEIAETIVKPRN